MAVLDQERGVYVVRIVYDGPPFSGKTTTLRALSTGLARSIQCPGEHDGRTLFFDWLDYTGGRFEGLAIRCQVVSVPGQKSLSARRRKLISGADAVVFVADSTHLGLELSLRYASEMRAALDSRTAPAPGIVLQANKRDAPDALPIPELLARFREVGVEAAVIETEASAGNGVREAFLFGVRLALDRVRELISTGQLRTGSPEEDSPEALLQLLSPEEPAPAASPRDGTGGATAVDSSSASAAPLAEAVTAARIDASAAPVIAPSPVRGNAEHIEPPDPHVPSGYIWPPVEGRVIVQQAASAHPNIIRQANGDLVARSDSGWRLHSRSLDVFADSTAARVALVSWARAHALNQQLLTDRRCIMASAAGDSWRLWQIVAIRPSLEDALRSGLDEPRNRAAGVLLDAAEKFGAAAALFATASISLPAMPESIASDALPPRYGDLMPGHDADPARSEPLQTHALAAARFAALVGDYARKFGGDLLVHELRSRAQVSPSGSAATNTLIGLLQQKQTA